MTEWGDLTGRIIDSDYSDKPKQFAAPSVCCYWTTEQLLEAGLSTQYVDRLAAVTAIQYPQSLCSPNPPYGHAGYMNQSAVVAFTSYDVDAVTTAVNLNIPYYIVETNSASCVGVADVSDTFTSAVWGVNMAMQFAYRNHSGVLLHNGGQNTIYNIFTPPSYNSTTTAWRTHPIFYSLLVAAEALRASTPNLRVTVTDQLLGSNVAAAYNIYENGVVTKRVLINMVNDPSGANNLQVTFATPPGNPASVPYKILTAASLAEKQNITWAGQTFGYYSEGKLTGTENIQQAACNNGACTISVPAPGVALVFMSSTIQQAEEPSGTVVYQPVGTKNPQIVLSSNGGRGERGGATSKGSTSTSSALLSTRLPSITATALQTLSIIIFSALLISHIS